MDEHRVLADSTESGVNGKLTLQQRSRVDDATATGFGKKLSMSCRKLSKPFPDPGVIIFSPCISGDAPERRSERRVGENSIVGYAEHQDRTDVFQHEFRMRSGLATVGEVIHSGVLSGSDPVFEAAKRLRLPGDGDADQFETESERRLFEIVQHGKNRERSDNRLRLNRNA